MRVRGFELIVVCGLFVHTFLASAHEDLHEKSTDNGSCLVFGKREINSAVVPLESEIVDREIELMIVEAEKFALGINIKVQHVNIQDTEILYFKGILPKAAVIAERVELNRLKIELRRVESRIIQLHKGIEAIQSQLIGARLGNTLPDDSPEAVDALLDALISRLKIDMDMNRDMLEQRALERPLLVEVLEFTKKMVAKGFENIGQQLMLEDQLRVFDHWTEVIYQLRAKRQRSVEQFEREKACVFERW